MRHGTRMSRSRGIQIPTYGHKWHGLTHSRTHVHFPDTFRTINAVAFKRVRLPQIKYSISNTLIPESNLKKSGYREKHLDYCISSRLSRVCTAQVWFHISGGGPKYIHFFVLSFFSSYQQQGEVGGPCFNSLFIEAASTALHTITLQA